MARDRQRAKQRRARRAEAPGNPGPAPSTPESPHSHQEFESEDQQEFEAAIVTGSGEREANADAQDAFGGEEVEADDRELERQAVESGPAAARAAERPAGTPTKRGPARFAAFLRACWSELQRVQWPDRHQVGQATAVVIGFVVVAGLYLGVADYVAKELVNAII
ncbi:MAG: preprotein translocase subunit SecE [Solirubrobacteraceae bacterium]